MKIVASVSLIRNVEIYYKAKRYCVYIADEACKGSFLDQYFGKVSGKLGTPIANPTDPLPLPFHLLPLIYQMEVHS
jgi:hypothetical protein